MCILQELLQRLEIHNIAAVSYVRDDDQHILAFKTGKSSAS